MHRDGLPVSFRFYVICEFRTRISWILRAANFDNGRRCFNEESGRAKSSASAEHEIMYLIGTKEARRPKGPAKLKENLEKREAVLSKWRDGTISANYIFIRI